MSELKKFPTFGGGLKGFLVLEWGFDIEKRGFPTTSKVERWLLFGVVVVMNT